MSPTPNYVHNLAVAVVLFSLQSFPLHHSPACFYFHRTTSLFLSPDQSLTAVKTCHHQDAAESLPFTASALSLLQEVCVNRQVFVYLARASFGCMLFLSSKIFWSLFYILSMFTWSSGFAHNPQLRLTLINHASPRFPPFICTLSAALQLVGCYRFYI